MEFKDDEIKRLQLAAEAEEKKRFLKNAKIINESLAEKPEAAREEEAAPAVEAPDSPYLKQIRTFQGDVASALKDQNESLVSIQKRQAEKTEAQRQEEPVTKKGSGKTIAMIGAIVLFVALGIGGGYYAFVKYQKQNEVPVVNVPLNRFFPTREERSLNATNFNRNSFIDFVRSEVSTPSSAQTAGITQIQLRKGGGELADLIKTSEFLVLLESRAPAALVRAFDNLFMFGFIERDSKKPFVLIKLESFEQSYPGMLEWERDLKDDLLPLFESDEKVASILPDKLFSDLTISNKDTRVLRDNEGKIVLIYTFVDTEFLLITNNEDTLKSLLTSISAGKLSR